MFRRLLAKPKTKKQLAAAILTYFIKLQKGKIGKSEIDRYRDTWPTYDLLEDFSYDEIISVLDYFFSLDRRAYTSKEFFSNFHKLKQSIEEEKEYVEYRKKLFAKTKEKMSEQ